MVVRSYDSHPGDSLWVVAKVVFPEKSRSVEAATVVSTALNTARVALESGRIDEARAAFQTVQDQLAAVDDADGRAELAHQRDYLTTQLTGPAHNAAERVVTSTAGPQLATGQAGGADPPGSGTGAATAAGAELPPAAAEEGPPDPDAVAEGSPDGAARALDEDEDVGTRRACVAPGVTEGLDGIVAPAWPVASCGPAVGATTRSGALWAGPLSCVVR